MSSAVKDRHAATSAADSFASRASGCGAVSSAPTTLPCSRQISTGTMPGVAGIELNISCPNVGKGGLQFAIDAEAAGAVTAAVRGASDLPLLVKLSPNVADVRPIARAIEKAGADAITAINTLSGMAVRPDRTRPLLGNIYGGLSGPAIKPVALRIVYEVAQVVDIPIVAIGGVSELSDVLDFLAVGAVAVQVGTALFADPTLPVRLVDGLEAECRRRGLDSLPPLIGTALPRKPGLPRRRAWSTARDLARAAGALPGRPARLWPDMTTIRSAIDEAARAAIARRTEELFRRRARCARATSCSRAAATATPTSRSSRSSRTPRRPASCAASGPRHIATRPGRPPSTSSPARRPAASSSRSRPAASSGSGRSSPRRSATPTGSSGASSGAGSDRARRAGPARRRHPDDRRLAPGDDPGDRGDRRRDRRLPSSSSIGRRRDEHADLADRPAGSIRCARCGGSTCRPTSRAPRPARAAPPATPLHTPGSTGPGRDRVIRAGRRVDRRRLSRPASWSPCCGLPPAVVAGDRAGGRAVGSPGAGPASSPRGDRRPVDPVAPRLATSRASRSGRPTAGRSTSVGALETRADVPARSPDRAHGQPPRSG